MHLFIKEVLSVKADQEKNSKNTYIKKPIFLHIKVV